jgi:hypothetical protein
MDLDRRAKLLLDNPEKYPALEAWPVFELVFRIWRYPALTSCSSWLLRENKGIFHVRRLEWDRFKDSRWPRGEPTIYGSESPVPTEEARSIVQRLRAISLPPFVEPRSFGIDGVTFGVEMMSYSMNRRLSWWCDAPEGWEPLAEWLGDTVAAFDALLPESTAKMNE